MQLERVREWAVPALLALTVFAAPALGVTNDEMVQDTFKSALVAFGTLGAGFVFFWSRRESAAALRLHGALALPALLMAYALGSMAWSHPYLAGVEAIRWFVFALVMLLALNTMTRERLPLVAGAIAGGGAVASLWAALQFFFDLSLFPQGPHPASTFVNRNFFAEFAVCSLPFAGFTLARARRTAVTLIASAMVALIVLAICMTGTRAALVAMLLQLVIAFPFIAWRWPAAFAFPRWPPMLRTASAAVILAIVAGLGMVPTGDQQIANGGRGVTALERASHRTASISADDPSLSVRALMWRATGRMIAAHPVAGVGAGAWENEIPLFQPPGSQLETDFYAHNEFLQLVAEYGTVGWLFLVAVAAWLCRAAWRTWELKDADEAAWRATVIASVAALLVVSNAGFPWRLASTGALFALCLGSLAASDLRIARAQSGLQVTLAPAASLGATAVIVAAIGLAAHITLQAAAAERNLVRATHIALAIGASRNPDDPAYDKPKADMLRQLAEGIRINRHYRKLTPVAADAMARWGDWKDAIWVWESVLSSRPNVVAILCNVTRGYIVLGELDRAARYLERAKAIQPDAPAVMSVEAALRDAQQLRAQTSASKG